MERKQSKSNPLKEKWGLRLGLSRKQEQQQNFVARKPLKKLPVDTKAHEENRRLTQELREKLKDESVQALPEGYFEEGFDPPLYELQGMPASFQASDLDGIAEERANVLEIVSERLSKHVLANYDMFVEGINEAASVEADLQDAITLVKSTRHKLASSQAEISEHMTIAFQQQQKQQLAKVEKTLIRIQQTAALRDEMKEAQENGEYAQCFWLCAECCKNLENLQTLGLAGEFYANINRLYADNISRLEAALASTCAEFDAAQYCKVLEGYGFLGNTAGLGEEVNSCFVSVINSSALKVVRGVILTRAGLEEQARSTSVLQEIVKCLPPDLYRQCLARVLMVIFDILASHHRMLNWHMNTIEALLTNTEEQKPDINLDESPEIIGLEESQAGPRDHETAEIKLERGSSYAALDADDVHDTKEQAGPDAEEDSILDRRKSAGDAEAPSEDVQQLADISAIGVAQYKVQKGFQSSLQTLVTGGRLQATGSEAERDPLSDGGPTDMDRETQAMWSEALVSVSESMTNGRRGIWDEAARKVATLLAAPAALQGEHFLQALEWTQSIAQIGEAFSQTKSSSLRDTMQRHSGRFFQAYHASNLQALQAMLDQELWKPLPMPADRQTSFKAALEGSKPNRTPQTFDTSSFADWVEAGNPWKKQESVPEAPSKEDISPNEDVPVPPDSKLPFKDPLTNGHPNTPVPIAEKKVETVMTTASWRMLQWMSHYADLMRLLPPDSGKIYSSCCELFELYFLHVFHCFSDVTIAELLSGQIKQGGPDAIPVRLQNAVTRIMNRCLPKLKSTYLPMPVLNGSMQGSSSLGQSSQNLQSPGQNGAVPCLPAALSNPGNMYGLQERRVAVESLSAVARQLQEAQGILSAKLEDNGFIPDHHSLDTFMQTVKAASDLGDVVLRAAARLNLPIDWIPGRLAEQNFNLEEPPTQASPWVGVLLNHVRMFHHRLETVGAMSNDDIVQLWQCGLTYTAEVVLEGLARAGARGKCTVMGRSAMSLDLQGLQRGLQGIVAGKQEMAINALRVVDAFIKAYYIPWGQELHRWAITHPEYKQDQIFALINCIADSNNLRRRERTLLISEIQSDLNMMQ